MFSDEFSNLKESDLFEKAKETKQKLVSDSETNVSNVPVKCQISKPSTGNGTTVLEQSTSSDAITTGSASDNTANFKKSHNSILVNPNQKGNPLLKFIINVPWEYDNGIVPDYVVGRTNCILFLSLRYHNLHPNYIYERLKRLKKMYDLRILLVQVDIPNPEVPLKLLNKISLLAELTLILAWSAEEAGSIVATYKIYENKPPDFIMGKQDADIQPQLINALAAIKSVNRTDGQTLLSTFGSLANIINASKDSLSLCPGLGPSKASQLHDVLKEPFLKSDNKLKDTKKNTLSKYFQRSQQNEQTPEPVKPQ